MNRLPGDPVVGVGPPAAVVAEAVARALAEDLDERGDVSAALLPERATVTARIPKVDLPSIPVPAVIETAVEKNVEFAKTVLHVQAEFVTKAVRTVTGKPEAKSAKKATKKPAKKSAAKVDAAAPAAAAN